MQYLAHTSQPGAENSGLGRPNGPPPAIPAPKFDRATGAPGAQEKADKGKQSAVSSRVDVEELSGKIDDHLAGMGPTVAHYARKCDRRGFPELEPKKLARDGPEPLGSTAKPKDLARDAPEPLIPTAKKPDVGRTQQYRGQSSSLKRDFGPLIANYAHELNRTGLPAVDPSEMAEIGPLKLSLKRKKAREALRAPERIEVTGPSGSREAVVFPRANGLF
jgi:hypothetical protein